MSGPLKLVACSHGTRALQAQRLVSDLVRVVAERLPGVMVTEMFVDVQEPALETSLPSTPGEVVVVPLFLSGGYHLHHDIARAVAQHPRAHLSDPLGPDPALTEVQVQRLRAAGLSPHDAVVMAASASSDQRAVRDLHRAAALLGDRLGTEVTVGVVGGAGAPLKDVVDAARRGRARVLVSSYLLMPGHFHGQVLAAGADAVTAPLLTGAVPAPLVDLVTRRFDQAAGRLAA